MHLEPIPGPLPARPAGPPVTAYAVMHALRALELLAVRPASAPEVADAVGVSARTARRLLYRLRDDGYLVQDGGHRRRFRPTLRLAALGARTANHNALPAAAAPALTALSARTGGAASLWVASDGDPVRVLHHEVDASGQPAVEVRPDLDASGPVHAVLSPARNRSRSYAYARAEDGAAAAVAVLDGTAVVAALELAGDLGPSAMAAGARAADDIRRRVRVARNAI